MSLTSEMERGENVIHFLNVRITMMDTLYINLILYHVPSRSLKTSNSMQVVHIIVQHARAMECQ